LRDADTGIVTVWRTRKETKTIKKKVFFIFSDSAIILVHINKNMPITAADYSPGGEWGFILCGDGRVRSMEATGRPLETPGGEKRWEGSFVFT
jgi:hypothetical protein